MRERHQRLALAGLVLVFLVLRALHLTTAIELISFDEELYRGTIAVELVEGLKTGLWAYQADDYSGGSLVVGLLAAPLFVLLGPRLVVLKLVPLAFSLATLLLVIVFLRRQFGAPAALLGATLFLLAPPAFTQLGWLAMGFHTESLLFSMLILTAFVRLREDGRRRAAWAAGFGVLSGLGFWFTYITALTTLACLAAWLVLEPRTSRGTWATALAGLVVGLGPWLAYNVTHGFAGLHVPTLEWPSEALESVGTGLTFLAKRAILVPAVGLPYSLGFPSQAGVQGGVFDCLYSIVAGLALLGALPMLRRRAPAVLPLVLYPGLFFLAYVVTGGTIPHGGHVIEARYFPPLHLVLIMLLAVALTQAPRGRLLAALLLVLGALGQGTLLFREDTPGVLRYAGYSYAQLGHLWQSRRPLHPETAGELWDLLRRFPPDRGRTVFSGFLDGGFAEWTGDLSRVRNLIAQAPSEYRSLLAEGLGYAAGLQHGGVADNLHRAIAFAPDEARDHFYAGLGGGMAALLADRPGEHLQRLAAVEVLYRHHLYTSLGLVLRRCYAPRPSEQCPTTAPTIATLDVDAQAALARGLGQASVAIRVRDESPKLLLFVTDVVPPQHRGDFFWGLGWTLRATFNEDRARALDWIHQLPLEARSSAVDGLRACEAWYGLEAG